MRLSQFFRENGWCQHSLAYDEYGNMVSPLREDAVSYCLVGAALKLHNDNWDAIKPVIRSLGLKLLGFSETYEIHQDSLHSAVVKFNNKENRTKEEIIQLCEEVGV